MNVRDGRQNAITLGKKRRKTRRNDENRNEEEERVTGRIRGG